MKHIFYRILRSIVKDLIKKHRPTLIGVTGNVGKTTTRVNLTQFLAQFSEVGTNLENYNTPLGVCLSFLGFASPGKNLLGWGLVLLKAVWIRIFGISNFPPVWVIEIGLDHPGDMDQFVDNFLVFDVVVFVFVGEHPVHLAQFENRKELINEKGKILRGLKSDGVLIINGDDPYLKPLYRKRERVITYGYGQVDLKASDFKTRLEVVDTKQQWEYYYTSIVPKASFKVEYRGSSIPFQVDYVLAKHQVIAILPAIALGIADGMNLIDISQKITAFKPLAGRLRCMEGIKDTLLIDDSYNAAPAAVAMALEALANLSVPGARKVAILGVMRELGAQSEAIHQVIGKLAAQSVDVCIGIGEESKAILMAFHQDNPSGLYHWFADSEEAASHIIDFITSDDIILVKGSQFSRVERVSAVLIANKRYKQQLLPRQSDYWLNS